MVYLESYDSEGPVTPETDDSTEVRSKNLPQSGRFCWLNVAERLLKMFSSADDLANRLVSIQLAHLH